MDDSVCHLTISFGTGIKNDSQSLADSYVVMSVPSSHDGAAQYYKTLCRSGPNPQWNEKFVFDIRNPNIPIEIIVYNKEMTSKIVT
jgi:Ca2+-dependent lipid-binding protein